MKKVSRLSIAHDDPANMLLGGVGASEPVAVRTTGRIKKPKTVFDPSDNYLPRSYRSAGTAASASLSTSVVASTTTTTTTTSTTSNAASEQRKNESPQANVSSTSKSKEQEQSQNATQVSQTGAASSNVAASVATTTTTAAPAAVVVAAAAAADACFVCHKRDVRRGSNVRNKMYTCNDCNRKVHKLCLKIEFEDLDMVQKHFRCEKCRACVECNAFSDFDAKSNQKELITCIKCVKSYHLTCHIPNVLKYQQYQRSWKCNKCSPPKTLNNSGNSVTAAVTVDRSMPVKTIREIIGDDSTPTTTEVANIKPITGIKANLKRSLSSIESNASSTSVNCSTNSRVSSSRDRSIATTANGQSIRNSKERTQMLNAVTATVSESKKKSRDEEATPIDKNGSLKEQKKCDVIKTVKESVSSSAVQSSALSSSAAAAASSSSSSSSASASTVPVPATGTTEITYNVNDPIALPDVKLWGVEQVATFFEKYFPNEAHVFRDHEIDGLSLLLLTRSDIIKKLPLKLGPSLRIYSLILKIQAQSNDPTLGWQCGLMSTA